MLAGLDIHMLKSETRLLPLTISMNQFNVDKNLSGRIEILRVLKENIRNIFHNAAEWNALK